MLNIELYDLLLPGTYKIVISIQELKEKTF